MQKTSSRKSPFIIALCLAALLLLAACSQTIANIKTEKNIGEKVSVTGTVENTFKLADMSGFTLKDDAGDEIRVSSKSLPEEGKVTTVSGTLMKDSLFGWYIKANE